jgi:hypothetical protein
MKTCTKCQSIFDSKICRVCQKVYMEKYRVDNAIRISEQAKLYYENNKEKILKYHKKYYLDNKDNIIKYQNEHEKKKRLIDPVFKLRKNCSTLIGIVLKGKKSRSSILKYLPYTMNELRSHLEKQFDQHMTWENYGSYWHIDHIIPQSKLLYYSMLENNFQKCWALDNLRPLEAMENMRKSNKVFNGK